MTVRPRAPQQAATRRVEQYEHTSAARPTSPSVGRVDAGTGPPEVEPRTYAYDPHLDPNNLLPILAKAANEEARSPTALAVPT